MDWNWKWPAGIGGAYGQLLFLLLGTIAIVFYRLGTGELIRDWEEGFQGDDDDDDGED